MIHDFQRSLHGSVAASQSVEKNPVEGDVTTPCSTSPPRILHSYQQHIADYVHLFMEEGEELTLSEDWATLFIVEVFLSILLYQSIYCITAVSCLAQSNLPISLSRSYKRYAWQITLEKWPISCNPTVRSSTAGVSFWSRGPPLSKFI